MLITESLTTKRMQCIQKMKILRHKGVITSYWTVDGKVFYSFPNDPKKKHPASLQPDDITQNKDAVHNSSG